MRIVHVVETTEHKSKRIKDASCTNCNKSGRCFLETTRNQDTNCQYFASKSKPIGKHERRWPEGC